MEKNLRAKQNRPSPKSKVLSVFISVSVLLIYGKQLVPCQGTSWNVI